MIGVLLVPHATRRTKPALLMLADQQMPGNLRSER